MSLHDWKTGPEIVPVSLSCLHCEEAVLPSDPHDICAVLNLDGTYSKRVAHWECAARSALGSVGHQQRRCPCFGGTEDDPPGMTKREAAKAALALSQALGAKRS